MTYADFFHHLVWLQDHIHLHPMINRYIKPVPALHSFLFSVISFPQMYVTIQVFVHPQVNAQVLVSSFSPDSHQWILLGQSMGRVLKACTASKESTVRSMSQHLVGGVNSIRARLLLCSRGTFYWIVVVLTLLRIFCISLEKGFNQVNPH